LLPETASSTGVSLDGLCLKGLMWGEIQEEWDSFKKMLSHIIFAPS
jgi:hypothetical protein